MIARSDEPILRAEMPYETSGLFPNVVFTCGHVPLEDGRIRVSYVAADSCIAAADFAVDDILASLRSPGARFGQAQREVA